MTIRQRGFGKLVTLALLLVLGVWGVTIYTSVETFQQFLTENRQLKEAIARLTHEDQIGYAKVIDREIVNGVPRTTLVFFQTDRDNPNQRVLEGEFTVEGDVVHFDSLIVKFDDRMVLDGKQRSMYLWRRIYGEQMAPSSGFPIESMDEAPARYRSLLPQPDLWDQLRFRPNHNERFWEAIWDLANDTESLQQYGIRAVYGNAVYTRMEPGKVYVFKLNDAGQIYPEVVEDF